MKWYRRAAAQGYDSAELNLGLCYSRGIGVRRNQREAVRWYRLAARHGNSVAQYNLGLRYERGNGVRRSLKMARYWFAQAAERGDKYARRWIKQHGYVERKAKNTVRHTRD